MNKNLKNKIINNHKVFTVPVFFIFIFGIFALIPSFASASTVTWTGSGNCSTDANWSGGVKPTTADDVVLNATSTNNMTWDTGCPATVNSFLMDTGYTGTVTVSKTGTIAVTGNMVINKGTLVHTTNTSSETYKLDFSVGGDFTLGANGTINLNSLGLSASTGTGEGADITGCNYAGGAGFGGVGGASSSAGGAVYGSITAPTSIGSGGGNQSNCIGGPGPVSGGVGGGAVKIAVTGTATISGTISVNGGNGGVASDYHPWYVAGGGGSAGSVYITTGTLAGAGTITAIGGNGGGGTRGGGGAGGRIAVYYTTDNSTITYQSYGGTGAQYGGAGTIYKKSTAATNGDLTIDNNGTAGGNTNIATNALVFDNITVRNSGILAMAVASLTGGNVTFQSAGSLANPGSAYTFYVTGNFSTSSAQAIGGANQTIEFSGTATQTISQSAGTFSSLLKINKTGVNAVALSTNFATTGASTTSTVAGGIFSLNGKNFTSGGTFTVQNGATLCLQGGETATAPTLNAGSTVEYTGNGNGGANTYTITGLTSSYANLTINSLDGATDVFQLGAPLSVSGNFVNTTGTFSPATNALNMTATSTGKTFTSGGATLYDVVFNGVGGGWTLQDNLTLDSSATLTLTNGALDTNGKTLSIGKLASSNSNTRSLTLGASPISLTGTGTIWDLSTNTNLTLNADTSTITVADTGASDKTFSGGSLTYKNLTLTGGGAGKVVIEGGNTFNNLRIGAPKTVNFTAGTVTTILGQFYSNGTEANGITIISSTEAQHTLSKSSGTVTVAYTAISFSDAGGGATWHAYTTDGNTNSGNNAGWVFQAPPAMRVKGGTMRFQGGGMRMITQ